MSSSAFVEQRAGCLDLLDHLAIRRAHQPSRVGYVFLQDGELPSVQLSYAELDQRARAIGQHLQNHGAEGCPVLMLFPSGLDFITAMFGCMYARAIGVPLYPTRLQRHLRRMSSVVRDLGACDVLTTAEVRASIGRAWDNDPELAHLRWHITTDLQASSSSFVPPARHPDDIAFIQYTSGSTGDPKGVMVSHANITHNIEAFTQSYLRDHDRDGDPPLVSWLPFYHDMGLVSGVFGPVHGCIAMHFMPPVAFLQAPIRWLRAVSRVRAVGTGGPNFAYELCVQQITEEQKRGLDLSSWRIALNGAELVRAETMQAFVAAFSSCGLRANVFEPCYGMAESTVFISGRRRGIDAVPTVRRVDANSLAVGSRVMSDTPGAHARHVVGCGWSWGEQRIAIVDPSTRKPCADDQIGEIWTSGPSVALGYWNRPQLTEEVFHARLVEPDGADDPRHYLRTGDLGFVSDGELFVTGRLKELIILRGRNYYPADIEQTVQLTDQAVAHGAGAAFSVEIEQQERLVVVHELGRDVSLETPFEELARRIRTAIAQEFDVTPYDLVLIRPLELPRTPSGKVQRLLCKQLYLQGELVRYDQPRKLLRRAPTQAQPTPVEAVATPAKSIEAEPNTQAHTAASPNVDAIERWLVERISSAAKIPESAVDRSAAFSDFSLDSVDAARIVGDLHNWLGRTLPVTLLWDFPSIELLAAYLASDAQPDRAQPASASRSTLVESGQPDPIAVVGLGCRFPGAHGPRAFWHLLASGRSAVTHTPLTRWDADRIFDADVRRAGCVSTRWGGFLDDVKGFDAEFFGVPAPAAVRMDPQQRLLLETAWEALEDAGLVASALRGSRTGVFVGMVGSDYGVHQLADLEHIDAYSGTGNAGSIAANRLSYVFDFRGPSMTLDTACSSSLVAVHLACESLRRGESDLALAGGVNLMLTPHTTVSLSRMGAMSPDGVCRAFGAGANGYVRGEGVGIVVLKRLSQALADGDVVYGVVLGSAVNQDGRTNGLTAPNRFAQIAVLEEAYARAGIEAHRVRYIEAHGTGTDLGDPIEAAALGAVLSSGRAPGQPCRLGSVKSNIGHLEAAAGIAGLIKVCLMLRQRALPKTLHAEQLSPHVDFSALGLQVQRELEAWEDESPIAGVSSFGFGGTNAHVVLRAAPPASAHAGQAELAGAQILTVSARSAPALKARIAGLRNQLSSSTLDAARLGAVLYTSNVRREHHAHRAALVVETPEGLDAGLAQLLNEPAPVAVQRSPYIVFGFGADNATLIEASRALWRTQPYFRSVIAEIEVAGASGLSTALNGAGPVSAQQPLLEVACQCALASLYQRAGVRPSAVASVGIGQLAALWLAGRLDARALVLLAQAEESERTQRLSYHLANVATASSLRELSGSLSDAVGQLLARHPLVWLEIGTQLALAPAGLPGLVRLCACAPEAQTTSSIAPTLARLFVSGVDIAWQTLHARPALPVSLPLYPWQHVAHWDDVAMRAAQPSAARSRGADHPLLGHRIRLASDPNTSVFEIELDRSSWPELGDHLVGGHWVVPAAAFVSMMAAAARELWGGELFQLDDLSIDSALLVPEARPTLLQLMTFERPGRSAQVSVSSSIDGEPFKLHAQAQVCAIDSSSIQEAVAGFDLADRADRSAAGELDPAHASDVAAHYALLRDLGLQYGPSFQVIDALAPCGESEVRGRLTARSRSALTWPAPALIDGAMQLLAAALPREAGRATYLPTRIRRCVVRSGLGQRLEARVRMSGLGQAPVAELICFDEAGAPCLLVDQLSFSPLEPARAQPRLKPWSPVSTVSTQPITAAPDQPRSLRAMILAEPHTRLREERLMEYVCAQLSAALGLAPHELDTEGSFGSLGLRDAQIVRLRDTIARDLQLRLSLSAMLDHASIAALCRHLSSRLTPLGAAEATSLSPEPLGSRSRASTQRRHEEVS